MKTVKQLKEALAKYDEDMIVVRADNSGGYEDIYSIDSIDVRPNFTDERHNRLDLKKVVIFE